MSNSITKKLRQQASLFVLGGLSAENKVQFEHQMASDPSLKSLVDELSVTLDISRIAGKKRPSQEFLQGQRNLLRHRIADLNSESRSTRLLRNTFSAISEGAGRLVSAKQPAWAIATYIMIAFIGGIVITRTGIPSSADNSTGTAEQFVMSNQANVNPVKISNTNDSSISFKLKNQPQVQLAGNVNNDEVKDMLYYSLLNDQNDGNRMKAVNLITEFDKDMVSMDVLIHSLLNEPNPGIRLKAIKSLKEYEPTNVLVQACTKVLLGDVNDAVRQEALNILSVWKKSDIVPVLQVVSGMDENERIRIESRRLLNQIQFSTENETIESNQ